jgi:tRNA (guanine37-N1)-methyltransferase
MIEAAARLLPGVLGDAASGAADSHEEGLLGHPDYTRPEEFEGRRVPEVLLGGHHARIEAWRRRERLWATWRRRPELLAKARLGEDDKRLLEEWRQQGHNSPAPESQGP